MPSGKKRKGHKMATHKRKKRLRKNRHKSKLTALAKSLFAIERACPQIRGGRLEQPF